jgi:cytochrome c oxidase subunit 2
LPGAKPGPSVRKTLYIQLLLLTAVIGAITFVIALVAISWLPTVASEEGERIDDLYLFTSVICIGIFALVAAVTVYAVLKFRAGPGDMEDGKPIHGHTGVEILWTVIPTILVTVIGIWSAVVVVQNDDLPDDRRIVNVEAQQFAWSFSYIDERDGLNGMQVGELVVRVNEPLELHMTSPDVIHSFWVPEWRQKQDVVPGITTFYRITPTLEGTYPIICTELCGLGHSVMRNQVRVLSDADFDAWVADQQQGVDTGGAALGQSVFQNQGCAACHSLSAADATGAVGPDLDSVLAGQSAEEIRQSIVDPNDVISEGFAEGVMPPYGAVPEDQLDALVEYLVTEAGG